MNRNSHLNFGMSFSAVVMIMLLAALSGCSSIPGYGTGPMKTTKITVDPDTKVETTVIEEPVVQTAGGFFESKNLSNYYAYKDKREDNHKANVKILSADIRALAEMAVAKSQTSAEAVLSAMNGALLIAQIDPSPAPTGEKPPTTISDFFTVNAGVILNSIFQGWNIIENHNRSSNSQSAITLTNTGDGNIFYQSDKNSLSQQTSKYTLGNTTGDLSLPGSTFTPANTYTDSNDVNNTRTDSANSETSTLW